MTLEELADLPASELKKLTDKQLEEILAPYFPQTRPEMVVKEKKVEQQPQLYLSPQKQAALKALEEDGIDLSFLKRKFKR